MATLFAVLTISSVLYIVYKMSERDYLGEFEHIVLLAVLRLGEEAYGVTVRREIEARVTAQGVAAVNRTQLALRSLTEGLDLLGSRS